MLIRGTAMTDASSYTFRDPRPLAGAVVVLMYLYLCATVANLGAVGWEFVALSSDPSGGADGGTGVAMIDLTVMITRLASMLMYAASGILFLKWTYRAVANARLLRPSMKAKPGWAVGWYFVPIAFLWKPFEYFKEAWGVSHNPASPAMVFTPSILRWWWGLWLVSIISSNIAGRLAFMGDEQGLMLASDVFEMISDATGIPLILIVVRIVQTLSVRQFETRSAGDADVFA